MTASFETWAPTALGPLPDHGALTAGSGPAYSLPGLGPLSADAEVDALADVGGGVWWFSLADWALLPGGVRAHPGDVVQWNGAAYAKIFDLLGCSFPPGLNVDAIDVYAGLSRRVHPRALFRHQPVFFSGEVSGSSSTKR